MRGEGERKGKVSRPERYTGLNEMVWRGERRGRQREREAVRGQQRDEGTGGKEGR